MDLADMPVFEQELVIQLLIHLILEEENTSLLAS